MAMRKSPQTQGDVYSDNYGCYDGYERPVSRRARSTARDTPQTQETSENDYDSINFGKKDNLNKIKVSNFSDRCSESFLENYFENKKTFGRDLDVESVQFYQQTRYAIVTFKDGRDAARVLEVHKSRPCIEHGCELTIELYIESEDKVGKNTKSIEVRGFSLDTEDDTLRYYFESKRHGGDTTESFKMSDDRSHVVITFEREGVVEEVLKREHEINNHQLIVKRFIVSQCDILFTNIPAEATEDAIQYYLEAKIAGVVSLVFSQDRRKVLVTFEETINFDYVEKSCRRHALHGDHMTPHPVAVTDGIIVTNIAEDSTSADTFWYYFENPRRSSGGDVYDVQLHADDGFCLVYFKDPKVVQSVCAQDEHTLAGNLLQVKPYNSCLGLPAGGDTATFSFPDPVIVDSLDPLKLQYLEKSWNQRDELERKLKDKHANISWEKPFPKIECAVTSSVRNYRQMVKSWTKDVQKVITDFDDMVKVREFQFDPDELQDIKSVLNQVDIEDAGNVIVKIDRQKSRIVLIAPKYSLDEVASKINEAVNKAKDSYKRKKERKTEKKDLKAWSVKYLKCIGFCDEMKRSYPEVDVDIREDSCQIIVTGPQKHVTEILLKVYEVIEQAKHRRINLEEGEADLLSHEEVASKIDRRLCDRNLGNVWILRNTEMTLYAEEHGDLRRMEDVVLQTLSKISVDLEKQSKGLLKSKEWQDMERKLNKDYPGCVVFKDTGKQLEVHTVAELEDEVDRKIKSFFSKNTTYKEEITLDTNIMKFIQRYMKRDLDSQMMTIGKKGKPLKFEMHQSKVTIEGTAEDLKVAKGIIKKFEGEVISKQHVFNQRGIFVYFSSAKGKESIKNVETSAMCIIDVMGRGLGSSIGKGKRPGTMRNFDKPTHCVEASMKSGQKIIVYGGDMTQLTVDMLVNAANKNLQHVGGLAAVIVRKGGSDVEKDCEKYIQEHGSLDVGEVFVSRAGNLKCSAVAHTVGPIWKDGNQGEEVDLKMAVENCLKRTDDKKLTSIAMPAISAGVYGYPVKQACIVIAKTVKGYFKVNPSSSIKEVYLCDISVKTVQGFVEATKATFKHVKIIAEVGSVPDTDQRKSWLMESASFDQDSSPNSPFGNCEVKLVKGEITKERVDVIVNSASPDLHLEKGKSSEAVLKAGGSKIQDECNKKYPNGIQTGDIAMTTGGKLHCKEVFHIALEPYKKHRTMHPIQGLKKSMVACLDQAVKQGYKSISFPAMGTGAQGYPRDKVAHEMFNTVANYCKKHPNMSLTIVRFVVYHHDDATYEAFISEEKHWSEQDDEIQPSSNAAGIGKVLTCKKDFGKFEFGSIEVKIFQGDITDQDTVAIVASCNRDLDLSKGAVTRALVKKGGSEIEKDCAKQKSEMQKKGIVVTTAGQLRSKYIIHVDTKYRAKEWETTMLKCLQLAEKHKFKSLAFPALGTSVGCKPGEIAHILSSALVSFHHESPRHLLQVNPLPDGKVLDCSNLRAVGCKPGEIAHILSSALVSFHQESPRHLQQVRVVVFQTEMLTPFIDGLKSSLSDDQSPRRPSSRKSDTDQPRSKHKSPSTDDTCSMTIYGRNEDTMRKAIVQLKKHVENDWIEKSIKNKEIANLHRSKIKAIKDSGLNNHVLVDIDTEHSVINLTGQPRNIMDVNEEVGKIMLAMERSIDEKRLAKLVTNAIKWYYVKDKKTYPFPDRENLTIETAYSRKDKTVRIKDRSGGEYEISFQDMEEWDVKQPKTKFPVIRKDLIKDVGHETPKHWSVMKDGQQLRLVSLASTDKEYQEVLNDFTGSLGRQPKIQKIERIQNVTLYAQYAAKKKQMESMNPKQKNERKLWHGTAANALDSINYLGFNRSYCGKNATALGAGVYFAVQSNYSDQDTYTPRDGNNNKHMYRARVLTGDYTAGNSNLRVPPSKDAKNPHILFDSVTNNTSSPTMFVIFHDTQAYPEYVITYQ